MKIYEIIILVFFVLMEIFVPYKFYTKNEEIKFHTQNIPNTVSTNIILTDTLYKKSYLLPNGQYVDENKDSVKFILPNNILKLNDNNLISIWIIKSNWGQYNYGNNPLAIEYEAVKKIIPNFPKTSLVKSYMYKYVYDEKNQIYFYQKKYVNLAVFDNIETCFDIYKKLNIELTPLELKYSDIIKNLLNQKKQYPTKLDTMNFLIKGIDTLMINDSLYVVDKKTTTTYKEHHIINPVFLMFLIYMIIKIRYNLRKKDGNN